MRGVISEILVESERLQRLDDLQNWHHFQTVLDDVWNFAVVYSRAFVSLLYFFTSLFGFLLGLYCFVSARFASCFYLSAASCKFFGFSALPTRF